MSNIQNEIIELQVLIRKYDQAYYEDGNSLISDEEYDQLYRTLVELETKYPEFRTPDSPTNRIGNGFISTGNPIVEHTSKMYSLANVFNKIELFDFFKNKDIPDGGNVYFVDLKLDGMAVEVVYTDNKLDVAATRGNGEVGEDITDNFIHMVFGVKPYLEIMRPIKKMSLRGEVVINKDNFKVLNEYRAKHNLPIYKNSRNAVAGIIRKQNLTDDDYEYQVKLLDFYIYAMEDFEVDVVEYPRLKRLYDSYNRQMNFLHSIGMKVIDVRLLTDSLDRVYEFIQAIDACRSNRPVNIDGCVVKLNSIPLRKKLGNTAKYPKWAVAYKFPAKVGETKLKDIELHIGRLGMLVPVAILDPPIDFDGVTVSRATLHNMKYINDKNIMINDIVQVQRSGDVIPYIVGPNTSKRDGTQYPFVVPAFCPFCQSELCNESLGPVCVNPECQGRRVEIIKHFASKAGLDMKGLGDKWIEVFVTSGLVERPVDLFKITKNELMSFDGVQERLAKNILLAINKPRSYVPLDRFISALGIANVGMTVARHIAYYYNTLDVILHLSKEELEAIPGIGEEIANSIYNYLHNKTNLAHIQDLRDVGLEPGKFIPIHKNGIFTDKIFVITGSLQNYKRDEIKELIERNGGTVTNSVNKKTNYLVIGENPGRKLQDAERFNVDILTETAFEHMLDKIQE